MIRHLIICLISFLIFFYGCKPAADRNENLQSDTLQLVKHNPTDRNYITFFHKSYYEELDIDKLMLFFTQKNDQDKPSAIGLILNHVSDDPIDIQEYQFVVDDDTMTYRPKNLYTIDDFEKSKTILSCQDTLTEESYHIIRDILMANEIKVRFVGDNSTKGYILSQADKEHMQEVLNAYQKMGGSLP